MWSPSDALLARYLANECSDVEARQIERWTAEDPANRVRLDELRTIWDARQALDWDVEGMWAGVRRTIRADRARSARFGREFRAARRPWWATPLAAAALLFLALGTPFVVLRIRSDSPATPAPAPAPVPMREYVTPRGQRATFQLSDGTRLVLAAESRLRVPADYGSRVREVYLEGEALFDVVHDAARPFRVRSRDAVVEDIGTRFDMRAYAEDPAVAVAVAEGAVALARADTSRPDTPTAVGAPQGVVLRQGEVGTLDSEGRVTTDTGAVVATYLAWVEGRLQFVETPLPEVARTVGRWYDLDVRIEGHALAARTLTAEFGVQPADELLRALALAVGARVVRSGQVVTLRARS
jgi:transmembrane sensor